MSVAYVPDGIYVKGTANDDGNDSYWARQAMTH